ncbi:BMP family ABC transporter substrate-binding protein [Mycoplasmopsis caviae]|uniref:BMP family ABC transporter substrate-binding protein n=1 Tax=Mycoplasmopsis caviae TaxID=55603 RepID=A0A3P8MDN5_9BACT|nr:BMP family ABC transporter substrate-binding protein [Mycoplasmopsis caviae]UUD35134.1 BMP family ABC transporter substrate-binding protein [Mycoplasmopsis caviae]VDR42050.1 Uncharacterised protein [Mycoplasmopsis caviae]
MSKKLSLKAISILGTAAAFTPIMLSAGCGETKFEEIVDSDGIKTLKTLADIKSIKNIKLKDGYTIENAPRTIFITDEGNVKDKSFNQSGWEALHKLSYELGLNGPTVKRGLHNSYVEPKDNKLIDAYKNAINSGFKYLVLNGFTHGDALSKFLKDDKYVEIIRKNKIVFIATDFDAKAQFDEFNKDKEENEKLKGHYISLLFETKQAGFMAGYAISKYLGEKYTEPEQKTVGTFGGIPYPAVTDFIEGLFKGMIYWNEKNPDKKVKSFADTINLSTNFKSNTAISKKAVEGIQNAQVVFPVAGSITAEMRNQMKTVKKEGQLIIGVDADQRKAYDKKAPFFTSVTKSVGQAIYTVLAELYSTGGTTIVSGFVEGMSDPQSTPLVYNKDDVTKSFVGVAPASILNAYGEEEQKKAQEALDEGVKKYLDDKTEIENRLTTVNQSMIENGNTSKYINYLAAETRK